MRFSPRITCKMPAHERRPHSNGLHVVAVLHFSSLAGCIKNGEFDMAHSLGDDSCRDYFFVSWPRLVSFLMPFRHAGFAGHAKSRSISRPEPRDAASRRSLSREVAMRRFSAQDRLTSARQACMSRHAHFLSHLSTSQPSAFARAFLPRKPFAPRCRIWPNASYRAFAAMLA